MVNEQEDDIFFEIQVDHHPQKEYNKIRNDLFGNPDNAGDEGEDFKFHIFS